MINSLLPLTSIFVTTPGNFSGAGQGAVVVRSGIPRAQPKSRMADAENMESDERALLEAVARGDREAFSRFYDHYARPMYSLAYAILKRRTEAEDTLQEVMVKIWRKAATYNPRSGKPLSWVMTLTRNHAIDRLRAERRSQETKQSALESDVLEPAQRDTIEETEQRENGKLVRASLTALPSEQRQAIELAYFGGLTHTEIATTLDQPVGTVKARIRRGMQRLRDQLSGIL